MMVLFMRLHIRKVSFIDVGVNVEALQPKQVLRGMLHLQKKV